jgi:SpoVK/Ycf46/Vps4 family AAA+-type ATPase
MARSDLLINLVQAERQGDRTRFRTLVEAIIAEERANQHHVVASRLTDLLTTAASNGQLPHDLVDETVGELIFEVTPRRRLDTLQLSDPVRSIINEVVEEHHRSDLLRSHNIEPRSRILVEGPPGNGKTTIAEAIATEIMLPLLVVRYEGVVSSFLGETASRLDRVFEFARTRRCVLFLDEFDSIAKERADTHETGEIKRVVSTLLLEIDRLPAHVVVVAATNHAELLDRAAWRRFQVRVTLPPPTLADSIRFLESLAERMGGDLGLAPRTIAEKLKGASYADLEQFAIDVRRRAVLDSPDADLKAIAKSRVEQWRTQTHH